MRPDAALVDAGQDSPDNESENLDAADAAPAWPSRDDQTGNMKYPFYDNNGVAVLDGVQLNPAADQYITKLLGENSAQEMRKRLRDNPETKDLDYDDLDDDSMIYHIVCDLMKDAHDELESGNLGQGGVITQPLLEKIIKDNEFLSTMFKLTYNYL